MQYISSVSNTSIKYARLVKSQSKTRRQDRVCFAEGLRLCGEAAAAGRIKVAYATEDFLKSNPGFGGDFELVSVSEGVASALGDTDNPQGVFCLCDTAGLLKSADEIGGGRFVFAENIADPGNLGTILRTAEAFGASGAILGGGCDVFSPKVIRGSMGGIFRLPIFDCADSTSCARVLQSRGIRCFAALLDPAATPIEKLDAGENFALIIGNEANGITADLAAVCEHVTIKMKGGAESLNAAAAAAVLIWELMGRARP